MPLYVGLANWTDQGIRGVKESVKRADAVVAAAQKMNCKIRDILWTMGPYDIVSIVEAPNDEVVSQLSLATGMLGSVRTVSMRAYTKEEMSRVLAGLP